MVYGGDAFGWFWLVFGPYAKKRLGNEPPNLVPPVGSL